MADQFEIKIIENVSTACRSVAASLDDVSPAWRRFERNWTPRLTRQFGAGNGWKALTLNYAKQKARRYPGRPILIASGKMLVSYQNQPESSFQKLDYFEQNNTPYFLGHQYGRSETNLPARPISLDAVPLLAKEALEAWLVDIGKAAGFEVVNA